MSTAQFRLAILAIILLTIVERLPSILHNYPIDDESVYAVVAGEMVDGGRPYIDAIERKPPLLFWTYAAVFKTFGKYNWTALHLVALAWTTLTMVGLFVAASSLFDRRAGLAAALLYGIFQPWAILKNHALNGELLMNLPIAWAYAIAFQRSGRKSRPELLMAGALLALAFLHKQPAAIAALPLGIYLILPAYRSARGLNRGQAISHASMMSAGFVATLALCAFVLWKEQILRDAIYWSIGDHAPRQFFWQRGLGMTLAFIVCCLPLLIGAGMARDFAIWEGRHAERTVLLLLIGVSILGTVAGTRFYPHYYIQLILPLTLFAAPSVAKILSGETESTSKLRPGAMYLWLGLTVAGFVIGACLTSDFDPPAAATAQFVREHSHPTDRIFVWGHEATIYSDAQRRPACRYITTFPLTGYLFGGTANAAQARGWIRPGAWQTLAEDFAKHPPALIIDTQKYSRAPYPVKDFPILANLLATSYVAIGETDDSIIYARKSSAP